MIAPSCIGRLVPITSPATRTCARSAATTAGLLIRSGLAGIAGLLLHRRPAVLDDLLDVLVADRLLPGGVLEVARLGHQAGGGRAVARRRSGRDRSRSGREDLLRLPRARRRRHWRVSEREPPRAPRAAPPAPRASANPSSRPRSREGPGRSRPLELGTGTPIASLRRSAAPGRRFLQAACRSSHTGIDLSIRGVLEMGELRK